VARVDKIIQKMRNQPHSIRYEEVAKVLEHHGYVLARSNGSHRHFRNDVGNLITIKEETPI
jgi:predicted RNA binding protein YcfA (HicA-like mRNA interferase family)